MKLAPKQAIGPTTTSARQAGGGGAWGCAATWITARLQLGTLGCCARSPSWQSPPACQSTFRQSHRTRPHKEKAPRARAGLGLESFIEQWSSAALAWRSTAPGAAQGSAGRGRCRRPCDLSAVRGIWPHRSLRGGDGIAAGNRSRGGSVQQRDKCAWRFGTWGDPPLLSEFIQWPSQKL